MGIPLRVLNVEDSEDDTLLLIRHLTRAGYDVTFERVDSPEAMEVALDGQKWDIVVTDFVLPDFSGRAALALSKERRPELPVVFLSGMVQEAQLERAALEEGARDYLIKTNLARLVPAIGLAAGVIGGSEAAETHLMLCKEYLQQAEPNLAKATAHAREALAIIERSGDMAALRARAILFLGTCHVKQGNLTEAIILLRHYETLRAGLGEPGAILDGEVQYQLGMALDRSGDVAGAQQALTRARDAFVRLRLRGRADECRAQLQRLYRVQGDEEGAQALAASEQLVPEVPTARWAIHLEQAEYHLLMGDPAQSVREALAALELVEGDSLRCYECYLLLLRCAQSQGHIKDALNFALSARMMAMEAKRSDLAYQPTAVFAELAGREGSESLLRQLEQEYKRYGLDIKRFLPVDFRKR